MKNFTIKIIPELITSENTTLKNQYKGHYSINGESFIFFSAIGIWSLEDYKKQWREGLERILTHPISCLVISVEDVGEFPLVDMIRLYKENNTVYLERGILLKSNAPLNFQKELFTTESCYKFIIERKKLVHDGKKVGVWFFELEKEDLTGL